MGWMAWTTPTAIFFVIIGLMLLGMTVWQIASPSLPRKGFLPIVTTRGDRLFIALLLAAYIHLVWLMLLTAPLWWALGIAVVLLTIIMRWG